MHKLISVLVLALILGSMAVGAQGRNDPRSMTLDVQETYDPYTYKVIATLYDYNGKNVGQGHSISFASDVGYVFPDIVETDRYGQGTAYFYLDVEWHDDVGVFSTYVHPDQLYVISANTTIHLS